MHFVLVFCMFLKNWVPEVVTPFRACSWSSYRFKVFSGSVLHSLCLRFLHLIKDMHITVGPQSLQPFVVKLLAGEITQTWVSICCTLWGNIKALGVRFLVLNTISDLFFFISAFPEHLLKVSEDWYIRDKKHMLDVIKIHFL